MVKSPHVTVPYPNLWGRKVLRNMGQIQNTHMSSAKSDFILLGISLLLPSSTIGHLPWTSHAIGHHDDVLLSLCDHIASKPKEQKIGILDEKLPIVIPQQGKYNQGWPTKRQHCRLSLWANMIGTETRSGCIYYNADLRGALSM